VAAAREYDPKLHAAHEPLALVEKVPCVQLWQAEEDTGEKEPAGHAPHVDRPAAANLPTLQGTGYPAPPAQEVPGGHGRARLRPRDSMEKTLLRRLKVSPQTCAELPTQGVEQPRPVPSTLALG